MIDTCHDLRVRHVALGVVVLCAAVLLRPLPAQASEGYGAPVGSTMTLAGHGYGHGRGLSQWGAYGAALRQLSWRSIIAFYYPGTSLTSLGDPSIRVRLQALGTTATEVVPASGLTLGDGTRTVTLPTSTGSQPINGWRVVHGTDATQSLQWRVGSTWHYDGAFQGTTRGLRFANPTAAEVRAVLPSSQRRAYRGTVTAYPSGAEQSSVNTVTMSLYLRSVVPSEMPASWSREALRSQVVAARTYAAFERAAAQPGSPYDTCDSTACQVYAGIADYDSAGRLTATREFATTTSAVADTGTTVVTYQGALALTQFSASNGGWTADGGRPYLVARPDPYDAGAPGSPSSWTATISVPMLESAAGWGAYG